MRSIGKKNIKLIKRIVKEVKDEDKEIDWTQEILDRLPDELWDIWEGADSEINRIINDELMKD